MTNNSKKMQSDIEQQRILEAHRQLVGFSDYFCRTTPIYEELICSAFPDHILLLDFYKNSNAFKQSTEIRGLFKQVEACNFFDYFEFCTFVLFENVLPRITAEAIAGELTMMLLEASESSINSPEYYQLISSRCVVANHFLVLVNPEGHTAKYLGETLAMICQFAISKIDPHQSNEEYGVTIQISH